jgi:hypothetical protein
MHQHPIIRHELARLHLQDLRRDGAQPQAHSNRLSLLGRLRFLAGRPRSDSDPARLDGGLGVADHAQPDAAAF